MTKGQTIFFRELAYIQEYCIVAALNKKDKYCSMEELIRDVTSETIYRIMELFDGYGGEVRRCNIIDSVTGEILNEGIELHDKCVEFLETPYFRIPNLDPDTPA